MVLTPVNFFPGSATATDDYKPAPSRSSMAIKNPSETDDQFTWASESHVKPPSLSELYPAGKGNSITSDRFRTRTNQAPGATEEKKNDVKRLQYLRTEVGGVVNKMKRRSLSWRRTAGNIIAFSLITELVAVGYAIVTTRTVDMNWRMRSLRVLPMFLLPALSFGLYYGLSSYINFCDRRDQKTLDKLRDELKERTNYYISQQGIQKYDPDPATKAAAARAVNIQRTV